ncbi:hypothetical protein QE152_g31392 [Popillia japonica]|uniref:Uncharacterized protein n=1 Tax=Popillia japonica TaxID=7064 RepID=A0AAW1J1M6_POPJA
MDNERYFQVILDDFSHFLVIKLLKNKNEAEGNLKEYVQEMERQMILAIFWRKARILKCELNKTGDGTNAGKLLIPIENRLLTLLDKVTTEGLDEIPELGLQSEDVPVVSQIATAVEVQEVLVLHDEPIACASSNTDHRYGDIQALIQSNNNIATSNNNIARAISKLELFSVKSDCLAGVRVARFGVVSPGWGRCGPVWDGVAWLGFVWLGLRWCHTVGVGVTRFGMVWPDWGRCSPVWDGVIWLGLLWPSWGWYGPMWRVNHSITFKDPETGAHTNSIESSWRAAKSSMLYNPVAPREDFDEEWSDVGEDEDFIE